jgi:hypothetical protein
MNINSLYKIEENKSNDFNIDFKESNSIELKENSKFNSRLDNNFFSKFNERNRKSLTNLTDDEFLDYQNKLISFRFKLSKGIKFLDKKDEEILLQRDKDLVSIRVLYFCFIFSSLWTVNFFLTRKIYFRNIIINSILYFNIAFIISKYKQKIYIDKKYSQKIFDMVIHYE